MMFVDGGTLLHLVAFLGCEDTTEWLLSNGIFYPHAISRVRLFLASSCFISNSSSSLSYSSSFRVVTHPSMLQWLTVRLAPSKFSDTITPMSMLKTM